MDYPLLVILLNQRICMVEGPMYCNGNEPLVRMLKSLLADQRIWEKHLIIQFFLNDLCVMD